MSIWVQTGESRVANILFGAQAVDSNYYLALYTAPTTTPASNATIASMTEPSTANGYSRIALARGTWSIGTSSTASYAAQTFTCSGTGWGNTYGYFVATVSAGTAGVLMGAELFSNGPYNIAVGDTVVVTPSITVV